MCVWEWSWSRTEKCDAWEIGGGVGRQGGGDNRYRRSGMESHAKAKRLKWDQQEDRRAIVVQSSVEETCSFSFSPKQEKMTTVLMINCNLTRSIWSLFLVLLLKCKKWKKKKLIRSSWDSTFRHNRSRQTTLIVHLIHLIEFTYLIWLLFSRFQIKALVINDNLEVVAEEQVQVNDIYTKETSQKLTFYKTRASSE